VHGVHGIESAGFLHPTSNQIVMPRPDPRVGRIKRWRASDVWLSDVWRLSVSYIRPKSRTERPRKTNIGKEVAHVTRDLDTTFKVKKSNVNLQGAGAYCGGLTCTACYIEKGIIECQDQRTVLFWGIRKVDNKNSRQTKILTGSN